MYWSGNIDAFESIYDGVVLVQYPQGPSGLGCLMDRRKIVELQ